ncbi:MAG: hypothetical protein ACOH16_09145 [Propionibacteriaceae bacterium]
MGQQIGDHRQLTPDSAQLLDLAQQGLHISGTSANPHRPSSNPVIKGMFIAALSSSFTLQKRNGQASTDTQPEESCTQCLPAEDRGLFANRMSAGAVVSVVEVELVRLVYHSGEIGPLARDLDPTLRRARAQRSLCH